MCDGGRKESKERLNEWKKEESSRLAAMRSLEEANTALEEATLAARKAEKAREAVQGEHEILLHDYETCMRCAP